MFNTKMVMRLNLFRMHRTQRIYLSSFCSNSSPTSHLEQTQQGKSSNDQQRHEQVIQMGYANRFAFAEAIYALVKSGDLKRAEELMSEMKKRGFEPNYSDYNFMIKELFKHGRTRDAEKLFNEMCERNVTPTKVTYNILIYGYSKARELEKAFGVRERMKMENVEPCVVTFNNLLYGLCRVRKLKDGLMVFGGNLSQCIELYEDMKNRGIRPTTSTYGSLISICGKEEMELVEKLFNEMLQFNLAPDILVYNTMICYYVNHGGDIKKAASLHDEMLGQRIHPDEFTYDMLIIGHLKEEEGNLSRVNDLVYIMKSNGIELRTFTYNVLIHGLCKLKDFDGAYRWYREMVENGCDPDFIFCIKLVHGLRQKEKFTEAQLVCSEMSIRI